MGEDSFGDEWKRVQAWDNRSTINHSSASHGLFFNAAREERMAGEEERCSGSQPDLLLLFPDARGAEEEKIRREKKRNNHPDPWRATVVEEIG